MDVLLVIATQLRLLLRLCQKVSSRGNHRDHLVPVIRYLCLHHFLDYFQDDFHRFHNFDVLSCVLSVSIFVHLVEVLRELKIYFIFYILNVIYFLRLLRIETSDTRR